MDNKNGKFSTWLKESITSRMLVVGILILVLLIPLQFVKELIYEHGARQTEVIREINEKWGNEVILSGPILKVPYKTYKKTEEFNAETKKYVAKTETIINTAFVFPDNLDIKADIKKAAPNGVDIYFDNVGGPISDAVLFNINRFARMVICGAISVYNNTELPKSVSVQPFLVKNSALMQGFIVSNYVEKFPEAIKQLSGWLAEDKLKYSETIINGFDNTPRAFIDLFEGKNKGKMIVKI